MTDKGDGGTGWETPPGPHGSWPPPAPRPAPTTTRFTPGQSAPEWAVPQSLAQPTTPPYQSEPYPQPYGQPPSAQHLPPPYADPPGSSWIAPAHGRRRADRKPHWLRYGIIAAIVVALGVGGLFFFLSGDDITYAGRDIVEPEKALTEAESTLSDIAGERHGATNDQTACYFVAKNADTTDVEDWVVCGPVLFVDGEESKPYLTFALRVSSGEGDARLSVADEPDSPEPDGLDNPDLLRRPDGNSPPQGSGGLAVPDPPRADEGIFTEVPTESIELEPTSSAARIGSPTMSIDVPQIGEPTRYGRGDDARRPADGEKFIGFEIASGPGEAGPVGAFSIAVQVADEDPVLLPDDIDLSSDPVQLVISVPGDTDDVNLVVTEGTLVQKLSLTTGDPDPGNVAIWRRTNRAQQVGFSQPITIRASQPGFVTEDFPSILTVNEVVLTFFAGPNVDRAPSGPDRAFLVLDAGLSIDGQAEFGVDPPYWTLTLPDGTALPAADLHDDPTKISIVFDVPADLTTATLAFGGSLTGADGLTLDTLGVFVSVPLAIPEG